MITLFIGPIASSGGPPIKNKILLKYMPNNDKVRVCNTYKRNTYNLLKTVVTLVLSHEHQVIVSVSKNGRAILYPILIMKKFLNPQIKYSVICIGGTINEEALKRNVIKKTLKGADVATVETRMLQNKLIDNIGLNNIYYMPNYKEITHPIEVCNTEIRNENIKFVFLSRICKEKGVSTMISAFKEVLEIYPEAVLDIYGPVEVNFKEDFFQSIKNISSINYKGIVQNEDVVPTLLKYHAFIFPSEYCGEGFPAVLIEAYLAGLVVISSDINYNTEIVKDGENGWIYRTGDKEFLKLKLIHCFKNKGEILRISNNNQKVAQDFNAENVVQEYFKKLKELGWEI